MAVHWFPNGYDPACSDAPSPRRLVDGQPCVLELHRVPDYEIYGNQKAIYMKTCDGIIVIYDICDRESFEYAKILWKQIKMARFEKKKEENEHPMPILLLGNKTDREAERVVMREEGMDLAKRLGAGWAECSCKYNTGVEEAFAGLVRLMGRKNKWEKQEKEQQEKMSEMRTDIRTTVPIFNNNIEKNKRGGRWRKFKELLTCRMV
jgi:GTPase SAR1 family protein